MNREITIAYSLDKFPPHGRNPVTKKKFRSGKTFASALHSAGKKKDYYMKLMKKAYKQQTGRNW
jgi:hypothetical protein